MSESDNNTVREYLQTNLTMPPKERDPRGVIVDIGAVDLRSIVAEVGRERGYTFFGYDSSGAELIIDHKTVKISRNPIGPSLCRIIISETPLA